jgi:peptidoglycan hydrolase-like protein with peptidoglycan-binding domain
MHAFLVGLMVSVLWLSPSMLEAGEPGPAGEQRPEQARLLTKDQIQQVQERLHAEGVNPGPVTGALNPETEAALRRYQEKQGLPTTGVADAATLERLQIELPPTGAGGAGTGAGGR